MLNRDRRETRPVQLHAQHQLHVCRESTGRQEVLLAAAERSGFTRFQPVQSRLQRHRSTLTRLVLDLVPLLILIPLYILIPLLFFNPLLILIPA